MGLSGCGGKGVRSFKVNILCSLPHWPSWVFSSCCHQATCAKVSPRCPACWVLRLQLPGLAGQDTAPRPPSDRGSPLPSVSPGRAWPHPQGQIPRAWLKTKHARASCTALGSLAPDQGPFSRIHNRYPSLWPHP